jgi:hypothetical protein
MPTLLIPSPPWATPVTYFAHAADTLERATDTDLIAGYHRLICAELTAIDNGESPVELLKARRWAQWVIGVRLGTDTSLNPGAFAALTARQQDSCRHLGRLDGDVLHDHLRRATGVDQLNHQHLCLYVDAVVTS